MFGDMDQWMIRRLSVMVLLGTLMVIVLVLVLPQVDLLDTAFHLGTAPIVVHAQGTAKPASQTLPALFVLLVLVMGVLANQRGDHRLFGIGLNEVQVLYQTFRC